MTKEQSTHNNKVKITAKPLVLMGNSTVELSPLSVFKPIAHMPWSIWLDSCGSEHVDSRYDIIVWDPVVTLSTVDHQTHIKWCGQDDINIVEQDPLVLIKTIQKEVFSTFILPPSLSSLDKQEEDLPFIGGALGYFAYDLGRQFENLPAHALKDINLPEMAVGIYTRAIVFDNKKNTCHLICPEPQRLQITLWLNKLLSDSLMTSSTDSSKKTPFRLINTWQSNMTRAEYGEKFQQVQQYLLSGDCYQINLAQRFSASYQGDEFLAYQALRLSNKAPFSAFIRFDDAAILSISPERFLQLNGDKVQSKPIKGTHARHTDKIIDQANAQALQQSVKDRAENVMIVDLLRNDLSKVCEPASVIVPDIFVIESFPAVHHLVSTVEGKLAKNYDASDLLRAAFPGGSITGAPKIRAMEIIEELEPQRRSVYCGSIGYISACGKMDTSITIRTLICQKDTIYCWAGGGLVADSQVDCEYQETFDKVQRILPVLSKL